MKSVCAFTRKPDLSRADFQDYYEMHHAPLAVAHFPFRAYVRNHVLPGQRASFDTISEFWANDLTRLTAVREGPAGTIMAADEARFMDRARIAPARLVSTILSAGAQTDAQGVRWMLLLRWSGESVPATLQSWAQALAARQPGVTLDVILPFPGVIFPAQALLWVPDFSPAPPPDRVTVQALRVRRDETAKAKLSPHKKQETV